MGPHSIAYTRWKALVFGGLLSALAALMAWVGIAALDPDWTAQVAKGQYLVDAPAWLRAPVMLAVAAVCGQSGLWQLGAGLLGLPVVRIDDQGIEARTSFGRRRRLAWDAIVQMTRRRNQLILSPAGTAAIGQEIWDRLSVILDVGMLDAEPAQIEDLIKRFRPDLLERPG